MDHDLKFKQMTTASRQAACIYFRGCCNEGELERGAMAEAARLFSVTHKAMTLFWRKMTKKSLMAILMLKMLLLTQCSLRTIKGTGEGGSSGTGRN